jgi:hypothetical protein
MIRVGECHPKGKREWYWERSWDQMTKCRQGYTIYGGKTAPQSRAVARIKWFLFVHLKTKKKKVTAVVSFWDVRGCQG